MRQGIFAATGLVFLWLTHAWTEPISVTPPQTTPPKISLQFTADVHEKPFTGRVFVLLGRAGGGQPRLAMENWFNPCIILAKDVRDWKPGDALSFEGDLHAYPHGFDQLKPGEYQVQALMDLDQGQREIGRGPGNLFSRAVKWNFTPDQPEALRLTIDQVVPPRTFRESERVKLFSRPSELLSKFHGRPISMNAGVILPASHAENPQRKYPVVYEIPGFGGNHYFAQTMGRGNRTNLAGVEVIWVVLDPDCRLGHHVFADSANNGPCGQALVEEFIPALEAQFPAIGQPSARLVTGHSSGGWSSLWLQITYPDFFGGVWSTAPDPVDFRAFQLVNIYQPGANIYRNSQGRIPLARSNGRPSLFAEDFIKMEQVLGHGGQMGSFEAVFSPQGVDGKPMPLWNRETGAIDPVAAKAWEKYDIGLVIQRQWDQMGPKLKGKLFIYMGDADTFYLERAVVLLKETLEKLGSDAHVEIVPGRDHGTLLNADIRTKINQQMADQLRKHHAQ